MITVALVTFNALASEAIALMLAESEAFRLVYRASEKAEIHDVVRAMRANDPEILLVDVGDWDRIAPIAQHLQRIELRAVPIGFRSNWTAGQRETFTEAGISIVLREPFSLKDLENAAYEGLHRVQPITNRNILVFLPAKAGGGCSTVALNTAAALVQEFGRKVLLLEGDRRSGVLSIMLNIASAQGLAGALRESGYMTELAWRKFHETIRGLDLVLVNPALRGPLPTWGDYYHLLCFLQNRYEFLIADLPEVVNEATAELVKHARGVVLVCTPELPSIKMAAHRCAELEECEILPDKIHIVLNRFERRGISVKDAEIALERPVFATLPNDYARIRDSVLESRFVSPSSAFGKGCKALAEKLGGLPECDKKHSHLSLLQKLGRMME